MKRIIVGSHKGGVNKSTITANLGLGFAEFGYKTLLVDTDSQANLSKKFLNNYKELLGIYELLNESSVNECIHNTQYENLDIVPAKQKLSVAKKEMLVSLHGYQQQRLLRALNPIVNNYDLVIFDTAPGLDIMTFNVLQFLNEDGLLIIPIVPDSDTVTGSDSIEGLNLLLDEIVASKKAGENISSNFRVLLTEVDNDEVSANFKNIVRQHFGSRILETEIPFSSKHARRKGQFVIEKSRTKISKSYRKLANELKEIVYGK